MVAGTAWKRAGHCISRIPRSICAGVILKPCALSSTAAAIAKATLRNWCLPFSGDSTWISSPITDNG